MKLMSPGITKALGGKDAVGPDGVARGGEGDGDTAANGADALGLVRALGAGDVDAPVSRAKRARAMAVRMSGPYRCAGRSS